MSYKDSKHVVKPESIMMDSDGTLSYYFSNVLEEPNQQAMEEWAHDLTSNGEEEVNLSIVVDLPTVIEDLLAYGHGSKKDDGGYLVDACSRPALAAVRKQLTAALAMLDRIEYDSAETTVH